MADRIDPEVAKVVNKALSDAPDLNKQIAAELITTRLRQQGGLGQLAELVEAQKKSDKANDAIYNEYIKPGQSLGFSFSNDGKISKVSRNDDDITAAVRRTHGDELKAIETAGKLEGEFKQSVLKSFQTNDEALLSDIRHAAQVLSRDEKGADSIIKSIKKERESGRQGAVESQKSGIEVANVDFNEARKAPPLSTPTIAATAMPNKGWTQGQS